MAVARVRMDPPSVFYVKVMHPGSGADRNIKQRAHNVARLARAYAPQGATGRLRRSIRVSQSRDERGRFSFGYEVSVNVPYALYVHDGTGPSIRTKSPGKMKFAGTNAFKGQTITTQRVKHPGTPSNEFLTLAMVMGA